MSVEYEFVEIGGLLWGEPVQAEVIQDEPGVRDDRKAQSSELSTRARATP